MYGHYYLIFPRVYTRWMLYYVTNPIFDIPNVLYVYWKHYATFKFNSEQTKPVDDSSSATETDATNHLPFVPYEIDRKVRLTYHELQTSAQIFLEEYERVK